MTANTIGTVPAGEGKLHGNEHAMIVRRTFSPDRPMNRHNHPGQQIVLTVVRGDAHLHLDDSETHDLHSGDVLIFDGEHYISDEFDSETLLVINLINK